MNIAYILMDTEIGRDIAVGKELEKISGVDEIFRVYGEHDRLIKVRCNSKQELDACLKKIKRTEGVGHTLMLRVVDEV